MSRIGLRAGRYRLGALVAICAASGIATALLMGGSAAAHGLATTPSTTTTTTTTTTSTPAPHAANPPTISGTTQEGQTLTTTAGTWSGPSLAFNYNWQRCDRTGGSCSTIGGATSTTYKLTSADVGNTLRAVVTAKNGGGTAESTSVPTAVVAAAAPPAPPPPATGCPSGTGTAQVSQVSSPARLQIASFSVTPDPVGGSTQSISATVHVTDTCGQPVQGALVYVAAVPFNQFKRSAEPATDGNGNVQVTMQRQVGYPAARHQELLVLFIRARKPGESSLAGISTRRLVSVTVDLAR